MIKAVSKAYSEKLTFKFGAKNESEYAESFCFSKNIVVKLKNIVRTWQNVVFEALKTCIDDKTCKVHRSQEALEVVKDMINRYLSRSTI